MEEIEKLITNIEITTQENGEHNLVILTRNSLHALILYNRFSNGLKANIIYLNQNKEYILNITLESTPNIISLKLPNTEQTKQWFQWINECPLVLAFIFYSDSKQNQVLYGQALYLSV